MESFSKGTLWYPQRYQFVRNLEAALEHSAGRPFACLLITEVPISLSSEDIAAGLPHLTTIKRGNLLRGYLGNVTWKDACVAARIDFSSLPDTIEEADGQRFL